MRVFADTNVLVSAIATRGLCNELIRLIAERHELLVGAVVLEEFERVFSRKLKMPPAEVAERISYLRSFEVVPKPPERDSIRVRDETDRWILASAHAARADVLVTGDADLLAVKSKARVRIATPRELFEEFRRSAR